MNPVMQAAGRLFSHKLLWLKETVLLFLAAAHVPLWLWLPVSGYGWLAAHVVLPLTMAALLWFAWRLARRELRAGGRTPWLGLLPGLLAGGMIVWGMLSIVPTFGSVEAQTASFVARGLLAALLATGALLVPFACGEGRDE